MVYVIVRLARDQALISFNGDNLPLDLVSPSECYSLELFNYGDYFSFPSLYYSRLGYNILTVLVTQIILRISPNTE